MRLEDFARALAEQTRKDIHAAVDAASKEAAQAVSDLRGQIETLKGEVARLQADNVSLAEQLETARKGFRDGVDGKDGAPGRDGKDGRDGLPGPPGRDGKDGKDGEKGADGKDGRDGFSPDDLHVELGEDGRTIKFALIAGERRVEREVKMAVPLDRGVWRPEGEYEKGDAVTYAGALWLATDDTPDGVPGVGKGWRLAVKKGRDGRNGRDGVIKAEKRLSVGGAE